MECIEGYVSLGGECVKQDGDCKYAYGPVADSKGCLAEKYSEKRLIPPFAEDVKYFDWRDWGIVNKPKKAGCQCNGEWAFGAVAEMESWEAIRSGRLYELSA